MNATQKKNHKASILRYLNTRKGNLDRRESIIARYAKVPKELVHSLLMEMWRENKIDYYERFDGKKDIIVWFSLLRFGEKWRVDYLKRQKEMQ